MPKLDTEQLAAKTRKIIEMNAGQSTVNNVYFNPLFANKLSSKVPELKELGFELHKTESETVQGDVVSATITSPRGDSLSLGTILLDGKKVSIEKDLVTIDKLLEFLV